MRLEGDLERQGFGFLRGLLGSAEARALADAVAEQAVDASQSRGLYALRRLTERVPSVADLAQSEKLNEALAVLGYQGARLVQSIYFDKTPDANWKVAWHQDLSMPVQGRTADPAYGPWNEKDGQSYVQPPAEILGRSVILRLHLDDCGEFNGPLKVLPGSHLKGRFKDRDVSAWSKEGAVTCTATAGDAVLMKPLTLHASSPSERPGHRRVVHLEYSLAELPEGLAWQGV